MGWGVGSGWGGFFGDEAGSDSITRGKHEVLTACCFGVGEEGVAAGLCRGVDWSWCTERAITKVSLALLTFS